MIMSYRLPGNVAYLSIFSTSCINWQGEHFIHIVQLLLLWWLINVYRWKSHMLELHTYTGLFTRLLCVSFNIHLFTQMKLVLHHSSNCRQSLQTVDPMLHFLVTSVTDQLQMTTHLVYLTLQCKKYIRIWKWSIYPDHSSRSDHAKTTTA